MFSHLKASLAAVIGVILLTSCAPTSSSPVSQSPSQAPTSQKASPSPGIISDPLTPSETAYLQLVLTNTSLLSTALASESSTCQTSSSSSCRSAIVHAKSTVEVFLAALNRSLAPIPFTKPDSLLRQALQQADDATVLMLSGWDYANLTNLTNGANQLQTAATAIANLGNQFASLLP